MGKAVPKGIKSKARIVTAEMKDQLTEVFEKNKKLLIEIALPISKWQRNVMSGYLARSKKKEKLAVKRQEELRAKRLKSMEAPNATVAPPIESN